MLPACGINSLLMKPMKSGENPFSFIADKHNYTPKGIFVMAKSEINIIVAWVPLVESYLQQYGTRCLLPLNPRPFPDSKKIKPCVNFAPNLHIRTQIPNTDIMTDRI